MGNWAEEGRREGGKRGIEIGGFGIELKNEFALNDRAVAEVEAVLTTNAVSLSMPSYPLSLFTTLSPFLSLPLSLCLSLTSAK